MNENPVQTTTVVRVCGDGYPRCWTCDAEMVREAPDPERRDNTWTTYHCPTCGVVLNLGVKLFPREATCARK
jgi:predicted RNA-binding Zn-ribbon protein involved in translation (DUF1610 family)